MRRSGDSGRTPQHPVELDEQDLERQVDALPAERLGLGVTAFATTGQLADLELRHRRRARCEDRIVRHEALVRREALGIEGGARPPRQAVAAAGWELSAA